MLNIKDLKINVWEKEILKWLSLDFEKWKNYLILGKNWSWKSSLVNFLMWNPKYEFKSWKIELNWNNFLDLWVNERSLAWIFLSFQHIPEIPWIKLSEYLRIIYNNSKKAENQELMKKNKNIFYNNNTKFRGLSPFLFKRFIKKYLEELSISEEFLDRELNVGFSGWEKRKIEILQARLLEPKFIFFDEIDSGLDLDAFKQVVSLISKIDNKENSIIMITHNFNVIDYLNFDKVYVLKNWILDKSSWIDILDEIKKKWFN